jgi:hypothetical protein
MKNKSIITRLLCIGLLFGFGRGGNDGDCSAVETLAYPI